MRMRYGESGRLGEVPGLWRQGCAQAIQKSAFRVDHPVMNPVIQTMTVAEHGQGNCFEAAVASLLDMPLGDVPDFRSMSAGKWKGAFLEWVCGLGYEFENWVADGVSGNAPDGYSIAIGDGPRGYRHAVVVLNGELAHDPYPDGGGLAKTDLYYRIYKKEKKVARNHDP